MHAAKEVCPHSLGTNSKTPTIKVHALLNQSQLGVNKMTCHLQLC